MSDHVATTATQTAYPWRAAVRTALQTGIPAFISALWLVPLIVQEIVNGFGQNLPEGFRLWLLGAAAVVTATSTVLARIMAIPGVVAWTKAYLPWLAPTPK